MRSFFAVASGVLLIASQFPYIMAIIRRQTKPVKATWLIWASLDTITFTGMYLEGALTLQMACIVVGAWTVALLSLKRGLPGWRRVDKFCLAGAGLAIGVWALSGDPLFALMTSLSATLLGSVPTFVSAWQDPTRENKLAWTIATASCVLAVLAIPQWTLADASQPLVFLTIQLVMMYLLYAHKPVLAGQTVPASNQPPTIS